MARHDPRLIVLVFALGLTAPRWAAAAEQTWITVDHCEPITFNGHPAQDIEFTVNNKEQYVIYNVRMYVDHLPPVWGDSCHAEVAVAPPGWDVYTMATGGIPDGGAYWTTGSAGPIAPRESQTGFHIVLSQPDCCVEFVFSGVTLGDPVGVAPVCFQCPFATPTRISTWGSLKATYR